MDVKGIYYAEWVFFIIFFIFFIFVEFSGFLADSEVTMIQAQFGSGKVSL